MQCHKIILSSQRHDGLTFINNAIIFTSVKEVMQCFLEKSLFSTPLCWFKLQKKFHTAQTAEEILSPRKNTFNLHLICSTHKIHKHKPLFSSTCSQAEESAQKFSFLCHTSIVRQDMKALLEA